MMFASKFMLLFPAYEELLRKSLFDPRGRGAASYLAVRLDPLRVARCHEEFWLASLERGQINASYLVYVHHEGLKGCPRGRVGA